MGLDAPSPFADAGAPPLDPAKFRDPDRTLSGDRRAHVALGQLDTLWLNSGTLCNLACESCYIESSPRNDALIYLSLQEAVRFCDEARGLGAREIGITGGEPFMNPDIVGIIGAGLDRGFSVLVLTNAMRPMRRFDAALEALARAHPGRVTMRVSLDHHTRAVHEQERGAGSWDKALDGLRFLASAGFPVAVAGRLLPGESEEQARRAFAALFESLGLPADTGLVVFPQMDSTRDVAEISEGCWDILGVSPSSVMCASSRMVVHRRGSPRAEVVACTLLPYDPRFALGETLRGSGGEVALNHPHCARFCVLGGASCTA